MSDQHPNPAVSTPGELPIIPLLKTVVFPLTLQPLIIQRPVAGARAFRPPERVAGRRSAGVDP